MKAIANASQKRSLFEFEKTLGQFKPELVEDYFVRSHLDTLYDNLLEQNLCRIIEPFSKVQIDHVANLIKLPKVYFSKYYTKERFLKILIIILNKDVVERKLSKMILDKKFNGILDQGTGTLIIFDAKPIDSVYENSLSIIQSISKVVDQLYVKVKKLS